MKKLNGLLFLVLLVNLGFISGIEDSFSNIDNQLLQRLNSLYEQYNDNFINYLPVDVSLEQCKKVLRMQQKNLKRKINSLSYRNEIFFSEQGIRSMGLMVAGIAGVLAADLFMHHKLTRVTYDIANRLAENKEKFIVRFQRELSNGRALDTQAFHQLGSLRGFGSLTWSQYNPADSFVSQLVDLYYCYGKDVSCQDLSYSAYLTLYQLASKALTIGAVVSGVGLIQDIKVFQDKKKNLSEQYDKCTKMLALLVNNYN